ncbi:MAG: cytidylyltransferase domain-containing protein [Phycisphaerales bacterium]
MPPGAHHTSPADDHARSGRAAVAIVLARGGSKGLPSKNALLVAGLPCVAWTLREARAARTVARVVLSTDDTELARIGRDEGIEIVARPADLATDSARIDDAARHAIEAIDPARGATIAHGDANERTPVVILYGNVPVRPSGLIDRAVDLLVRAGADSVQSYAPVGKHHPWWTARVDAATGLVRPWEGDVLNHGVYRRQDLPPAYIPDGGVLVVTRAALFGRVPGVTPGSHSFFGHDRRGVLTAEGEVIDIDTAVDLAVADATLSARMAGGLP